MSLTRVILPKCSQIKLLCTMTQSDFKTVYKFPFVQGVGLINRLKLYQTVLTSIALPTTAILNQLNIVSQDYILFTATVGIAGIVPLYSLGYFANKLVGIVYLNEKQEQVKFAYLDFWGTRKDIVVPMKDIVPFSEVPRSLTDPLYSKIQQFSSKETLKLCTKYGILDKTGFNKIFIIY
ncbi:transmembrane protein 186 [Tribolium madens]|uniref:transmembrane protein 186 n=1 Tax=Tribolium madens TaxID=41895 RepID=UPI001CF75156|nr:transmembrane protein 186 [Tribolium madens]